MTWFKRWVVIHLDKRIERYKSYVYRTKDWIKRDRLERDYQYRMLTTEDRVKLSKDPYYTGDVRRKVDTENLNKPVRMVKIK